MNRKTKLGFIVLSVALVAMVALAGVSALLAGGSTGPASVSDSAGFRNTITYTVYDANGNLKDHAVVYNAVAAQGAVNTVKRMLNASAAFAQAATVTSDFNNIRVLCGDSANLGTAIAPENNPTIGTKCATVASGGSNPADAAYVAINATDGDPGNEVLTAVTFTASGAATITEIQLVNGTVNAVDNDLAAANVFAYRDVNVVLAQDDTIQITWTVDVD